MREWRLVVLLCTTLLCESVRSQEKWSRPETAEKRIDDWVPITASCPSCQKNLEPNENGGVDEIGSLLNPPAVPSARAFNFNSKQNNFKRAPAGEPYEVTTPPATSGQFFNQQQVQKIAQPVHFPVPFFAQQNPFQGRFQGPPSFQPQFTFIPQPQLQSLPKENKVTFPESPFIQQQNKGSVQLVYVPIEALQRQKPRFQADRPTPQQTQIDAKAQSPFQNGKLKFQSPPQPFDPPRFPTAPPQFEQEPNRFVPPPTSFEQDNVHFQPPSQLFEQEKPTFPEQLKEQQPEFLPQNEQPVAPQSYQFVEDIRNPPSNFFQFHDNRFQKPSFEEQKPKEPKPQIQQTFIPNIDEHRQESAQSFVSNFDESRPRPEQPQNFQSNFQETRPRPDQPPQHFQQNFQDTRPKQQPQPQNVQETRPRQESRPQNVPPSFQETRPRQEPPPQIIPKFEEPKLEPQPQFIPNFQETRPRQEVSSPSPQPQQQLVSTFQETRPRQEPKPQNFQETRPRPEERPQNIQPSFQETGPRQEQPSPQFVPKFEEPKLEPQPQFVPNFQETRPRQEPQQQNFQESRPRPEVRPQNIQPSFQETGPRLESPPQFIPNFEEPKLQPQQQFISQFQDGSQSEATEQTFTPNFESLRPKPSFQQNFVPNFQETRPNQEQQETFVQKFEEVTPKSKPKVQLSSASSPKPQQAFNFPSTTEQKLQTLSTPYPPPHQPPLSVYMEKRLDNRINEVLTILKDAKTIPVLDTIGNRSPKVFVGPSDLDAPRGYVKFELPYLSSLDITKIDSMADRLPFFVAPLNFKPPFGYAKIPFPPPHIGSVVVSSKTQVVASSTEFVPFALTSQLPTEVNSLQPSVSSTTQRVTEKAQTTTEVASSTPKRSRQRKPLHRGSLSSFSSTTPVNDFTDQQRDQFTTPSELQRIPESSPSIVEQQQFVESTPTPVRQKFSRKPVEPELHRLPESTPSVNEQQSFIESTPTPVRQKFSRKPVEPEYQRLPENTPSVNEQQSFIESTPTPVRQKFSRKPVEPEYQRLPENTPSVNEQQSFVESTPTPVRPKFSRKPIEQTTTVFETTQAPIQQQSNQFDNSQQQQFDIPQQQFFADQQIPQNQQDYLNTLPQLTQQQLFNEQQQPSQQTFFDNQQQYLDNPPQTIQEQIPNNHQSSSDINNQENYPQFISSSTEKQIYKNFQQIQPLSQYQVGNNFLNQQPSSTEQVQSASNPPQTVSIEPQTIATISPTDAPKLRQRLSYYDKLLSTSTQTPVEITQSTQNIIETSEKPRERPKLRPRQRLTTTRKPTTEAPALEEVSEPATETSTQRYNPLKRRRPSTTTTTSTTEHTEVTRNPLRSRTTTQSVRSDFVRSRSRRPTTTTTTTSTTTTTTTTEAAPVQQQFEDANDVQQVPFGQDDQKKIDEAASFWNEPVTIQQSQGYELDTRYTPAPSTFVSGSDGKFSSGEPPVDESFTKEKYSNEKKAHDPNSEKKTPGPAGRRGHWVRVRVKKPQDNLDTAESQNSLGPLSANSIQELVTKPTTEFDVPSSTSENVVSSTTEPTAAPAVSLQTTTPTPSTTVQPSVITTEYFEPEAVTVVEEQRPADTTVDSSSLAPSPSTDAKYPDDEQDEAFQRNLADMLAKFIGDGNGGQESRKQETTEAAVEESTAETQFVGSDVAEPIVTTLAAVTEIPFTPVTSTTTKVSMETEICFRGRCVKNKKNKQITDQVSEP